MVSHATLQGKERDNRIAIGVRLSGGRAHDVLVSYAVPTPIWKAAYRVVLDDKSDKPSGLLQGWAVIDNASQEDWNGVKLTLATGAPMSYALDLHTSAFVDRPDATGSRSWNSLRALDKVQGAGDLRKTLVASLRETTTATDTLTKTIEGKSAALATVRSRLQETIRELTLDEPKP